MVSIRKRVSKKRTRRQRRGKKQRGGQNNQQNMIERLAQNELQRKSQRGGGLKEMLERKDDLQVWGSEGVYFLKLDDDISDSLHLGTGKTRQEVLDAAGEEGVSVKEWKELKKDDESAAATKNPGDGDGEEEGEEEGAELSDDDMEALGLSDDPNDERKNALLKIKLDTDGNLGEIPEELKESLNGKDDALIKFLKANKSAAAE